MRVNPRGQRCVNCGAEARLVTATNIWKITHTRGCPEYARENHETTLKHDQRCTDPPTVVG